MSQYKISNVSLEIDMEDADFQDKYVSAFNQIGETEKKLVKVGAVSDITRAYCDMYKEFFDYMFGLGTAESLFCGKANTRVCEETFDKFLGICNRQMQDAAKRRRQLKTKYIVPGKKK